ncbi:serine/threonine protein kinase japonica group [Sphaerosporella brunnea]|uniref:Serine/threonine protein kinase japonica group n=1 Tax=Sphaerosporella brunnea TaxID=1250544 RepID=A0A5J5ELI1_9PEZI|nr:serine/threonine protein kinase japonica group [Sphaerosporella brunnea]
MTSTISSYQPERDSLVTTEASGNPHTDIHYDLVSFLSVAQQFNIDFLPVMWNALEPFGKGGTADINESVVNIKTNFAFKRTSRLFKRKKRDENTFRALISEVFILATPSIRSHPNIVDLEGICWEIVDDDENMSPVLVFLKSEKGDLGQYLCSADGTQSSFDTRLNICLDIGRAIAVLHSGNIVHGDIKPQNILVFMDQDGLPIAKVTDFGYSCLGTTEEDYVQLPVTRGWNAPECLVNSRLKLKDAKKADVYSFGLVCLHTLFRKTEFQTISILSEVRQLLLGTPGFSITQKASLWAFFQSTLSDPDSRNTDFETLMTRLQ